MQNLLNTLIESNIKLRVEKNQLYVTAPAGAVTKELGKALREHKADLIEFIRDDEFRGKSESFPTITANSNAIYQPFALTPIQHAYWMGRSQKNIELAGVSTHLYFESAATDLDLDRFQTAFNALILRHDMLRVVVDNEGMQRILPTVDHYLVKSMDFSGLDKAVQQEKILSIRQRMSHQVTATDKAPIFEVRASKLSNSMTLLHFSLDMLVLDALSMMILFREWYQLYLTPNAQLPELSISYRDYALAEEKLSTSSHYQQAKAYWWAIIDSLPPPPKIPLNTTVQAGIPPVFTRRRFRLEKKQWNILQDKARRIGITPTSIILAAFTEVLTLWSTSPKYTLNITLFNRLPLHKDINKLLGDFTSLMLLEVNHRNDNVLTQNNFKERAIALHTRFIQDLDYRAISGLEVMRELRRRNNTMMEAAMPVVFTSGLVYSGDDGDAGLLESFGPMVYGVSQTPQVSLDHQVMEVNGDLICNWDYVARKFPEGLIDTLYTTFCHLVTRLVDSDSLWTERFVVNTPSNQIAIRQQLNQWVEHDVDHETLHGLFIKQALLRPDNTALIAHDGMEISYGLLLAMATALAEEILSEHVIHPDQCIAVIMHKGWEQIVAVLAIHIAGGAYLPINADFPQARQELLLEQSGTHIAITQSQFINDLNFSTAVSLYTVERQNDLDYLRSSPAIRQTNSNLAYVLFTSGTTGIPKGVMIEHKNALNTVYYVNKIFGVTEQDRVLAVSALSFDLSVYDIFGVLSVGGSLVFPDHNQLNDPGHWYQLIREQGVTLWNSAPAAMDMLVDYAQALTTEKNYPSNVIGNSLRMVWLSGDRIPVPLPDRIKQQFAGTKVISLGGPTETSIWSIYYPVESVDPGCARIPYGKPLPNQTIHVLNDFLQPCPVGVTGLIYIGGLGLGRGYLNDPERSNKAFITHPDTGEKLYNSGDLGRYLDDGNLEILGRSDFQIKIRGYRIELSEIAAVLNRHHDIKQAVVLPHTADNDQKKIVAYLTLEDFAADFIVNNSEILDFSFLNAFISDDKYLKNPVINKTLSECYVTSFNTALSTLGINLGIGCELSLNLMSESGVLDDYLPWVKRAFDHLSDQGYLVKKNDNDYKIIKSLIAFKPGKLIHTVTDAYQKSGFGNEVSSLAGRNAEEIAGIISGTIVVDDAHYCGENHLSFGIEYFQQQHQSVRDIMIEYSKSSGEKLTVLEVGAGFGSLTHFLASGLDDTIENYLVSDYSEEKLEFLYEKYYEVSNYIDFGLYDLTESAELQGLTPGQYDVIVASCVLHELKDLRDTLSSLKKLLKPGGLLMAVNICHYEPSLELHLGLRKEFSPYLETEQGASLIDAQLWLNKLGQSGYTQANVIQNTVTKSLHQCPSIEQCSLIVARSPIATVMDTNAIKTYLSSVLPNYMVPHQLIALEQFPVTANGKVDYQALSTMRQFSGANSHDLLLPRNEVEQLLFDRWLAHLPVQTLSVDDDFFIVGGDSLLAAKLVRDINEKMHDFKLEIFEFFEHLSIEKQATLYQQRVNPKVL